MKLLAGLVNPLKDAGGLFGPGYVHSPVSIYMGRNQLITA
jgi:hypothetical protein